MGRPVIDATGLTGSYDFTLTWTPEAGEFNPNGTPVKVLDNVAGPSLNSALEDQLGLRLQPRQVPVEILVIDHLERPTPNN